VFVTRPAGYTAEPWFVPAATDNATFVLKPLADRFPYRFVHTSDLHVSLNNGRSLYQDGAELGSQEALSNFLRWLPEHADDIQSIVATGDLTDRGTDDEFRALRAALDSSALPVYLLPGNHDHMAGSAQLEYLLSRNDYSVHTGRVEAYERNIGPRWYSFDVPGLHVVAVDWHSHELGLDHLEQNAWLRADLESVGAGIPWILLSHDQPWNSLLEGLPSAPIATFSGHRHTSRVVQVGRTLHVNTPPPLFAGLDYSPPSYRIVRWDGARIGLETRAVAPTGLERATFAMPARVLGHSSNSRSKFGIRWQHQLAGAGHRAPVRLDGGRVIAGVKREDESSGAVEVLSLDDGSLLWRAELRASIKGVPATHRGHVLAVEVSGDVVSLDGDSGIERWRAPSPDPLRLFAWSDPIVTEDIAIVGDLSHVRAIDADTGQLLWERRDLSPYHTFVAHSAPMVLGETIVLGNCPKPIGMAGLDVHTGETVWTLKGDAYEMLGRLWPIGTPFFDEPSQALYVPIPSGLASVDVNSRTGRWVHKAERPYSPATPTGVPDGISTVIAGTDLVLLDRADGSVRWRTRLGIESDFAMDSYTRTPQALFAGPTPMVGEDGDVRLLVPGLDGQLYAVDAASGECRSTIKVGAPMAAPVVVSDEFVIALAVDGTITAIDRSAV
jgi:outer membrane protein assembly factor BamB/predicted MPP superfamily phosphohydrolase